MTERKNVATGYNIPWVKKEKTTVYVKGKKRPVKKVIYQIFEDCSHVTNDKFWISVFQECARGKFPRGFSYKNNLLTYRKGNKTVRIEITEPHAYIKTMDFFKEMGGIMSKTDRLKIQKEEEKKYLEQLSKNPKTWKDIKIEKIKEALIYEYVTSLSEEKDYTKHEKMELYTTINKGFMLKYFTGDNIVIENRKIKKIKGLTYNSKTRKYDIDKELMNTKSKKRINGLGIEKHKKKQKVSFMDNWVKYIDKLENNKSKSKTSKSSSKSSESTSKSYDKTSTESLSL